MKWIVDRTTGTISCKVDLDSLPKDRDEFDYEELAFQSYKNTNYGFYSREQNDLIRFIDGTINRLVVKDSALFIVKNITDKLCLGLKEAKDLYDHITALYFRNEDKDTIVSSTLSYCNSRGYLVGGFQDVGS